MKLKTLKNRKKSAGFTLIELLVAVTISGIILTAVMTSYASFSRQKFNLELQRTLQSQTSSAISRMTDKVRDYGVNIARMEAENELQNDQMVLVGDDFGFFIENGSLWMTKGDEEKQRMIGEEFVVEGAFNVTPKSADKKLFQPKVGLDLQITSPKNENVGLEIKTTISSRNY